MFQENQKISELPCFVRTMCPDSAEGLRYLFGCTRKALKSRKFIPHCARFGSPQRPKPRKSLFRMLIRCSLSCNLKPIYVEEMTTAASSAPVLMIYTVAVIQIPSCPPEALDSDGAYIGKVLIFMTHVGSIQCRQFRSDSSAQLKM